MNAQPTFRTQRRIEFRDTDAAGIAHFSVFFTWMESAEHELLRDLGLSVVTADEQGIITWPRVAVRCDYQSAVRFEDLLEIEVRVIRLGAKSVTYGFRFASAGTPVAAGEVTAVCCRIAADGKLQSIAIPETMRQALAGRMASG